MHGYIAGLAYCVEYPVYHIERTLPCGPGSHIQGTIDLLDDYQSAAKNGNQADSSDQQKAAKRVQRLAKCGHGGGILKRQTYPRNRCA